MSSGGGRRSGSGERRQSGARMGGQARRARRNGQICRRIVTSRGRMNGLQARCHDFGGEGVQLWVTALKEGSGCHPRNNFEKHACDLVHYI